MIGIIGGTGLNQLSGIQVLQQKWLETPFGEPSSVLTFAELSGKEVVFLARHGIPHKIAPHLINYRANLSALKQAGCSQIIAVNAVGGIHPQLGPTKIAVPDQIIDYTYGRDATIYDGSHMEIVDHCDFSYPYTQELREKLILAANTKGIFCLEKGIYGATQGPRLETAAEIKRLQQDGCDMVGMTGMPEAALARELAIEYASLALSVNWAAGISETLITMDQINDAILKGMRDVLQILEQFFADQA